MPVITCIDDLKTLYRRRVPKMFYDYAETGSWTEAAGAYHSRTPEHAERYTAIFERHRARIAADPNADIPVIPATLSGG